MINTLRKFFAFCSEENRSKFYRAIALGVLQALLTALKIPAIALCLRDLLNGSLSSRTAWGCAGIMVLSVLGQSASRYVSTMQQTEAGYRTCAGKRIEIAEHMRYMPMGYFNANSLGRITSVATNTMQNLENVATRAVMLITGGLLTTAMTVGMVLLFDLRVGLICLAGLAVFALVNHLLQKAGQSHSDAKVAADARQVEKVLEYVQGIAEVKAYRLVGKLAKQCDDAIDESVKTNTALEFAYIPWMTLQSFVADCVSVAIIAASICFCCRGSMELLDCVIMLICAFLITDGIKTAGSYSAMLRVVDVSVDQAQEILSSPTMDISGRDITPEDHTIRAEDIRFAYEEKSVINGISLTVPEKTTTAIVGPSGGGKSTLCSLLSRFWDVDEGRVTLGGVDIREYDMDALMRNFSFVFQRVTLFHDTVANNIRFGRPEASMDEVIAAAKKACCHDFIMRLPEGYDTVISEDGGNLSGGERQRLSIARAMLKDAPIIILDEATANVDPENEEELMAAIAGLTAEKTVIMIAHRLKTVRHANQILVVENGRITQRGTHEELMAEEGTYRRFIAERTKASEWKLEKT